MTEAANEPLSPETSRWGRRDAYGQQLTASTDAMTAIDAKTFEWKLKPLLRLKIFIWRFSRLALIGIRIVF